jgi:hypothetical protein
MLTQDILGHNRGKFICNKTVVRAWAENVYALYQDEPVFVCVMAECDDGMTIRLRAFPVDTALVVKEQPC